MVETNALKPINLVKKKYSLVESNSDYYYYYLKKVSSTRLGDPSPTIPTYRQKEDKGKESRRL